jgi:hypothetical protein
MVRSVGGIEWLILIYIYHTKIYVTLYNLKCIANFEFQKLLQNSMLWRSTCFYIVTFVHWNIVFIESCMYKSVLGKINKLQKKNMEWLRNEPLEIYLLLYMNIKD